MPGYQVTPDILTVKGHFFNFIHPTRSRFGIDEIAHALSHICRFAGHTKAFYSVAQHSVHVAEQVPACDALAGLLHDAPEAFIGDVTRPLKQLLPDYKTIEQRIEQAVLGRFELPPKLPASVKQADRTLLVTELRDLMPQVNEDWALLFEAQPLAERITPLPPNEARALFLDTYHAITNTCEVTP